MASFTNAVVAYDTYSAGPLFSEDDLEPWILTLDELDAQFDEATGRPTSLHGVRDAHRAGSGTPSG
ncbi:hypothetical protein GCM10025876_22670 [Demequina litorisediminis]|uniref:Uncharacterized protein n=1 Tax=Demequina litorisediminis TaxID=1849022 RepID=A0ABQ6IH54_9MICO|nr:hypothetical protein GCM10025876_22670 [Demequina litorisediminis]